MTFTEKTVETARRIANVFETSKPEGDYAAIAVLDDGAGISYGVKQFTHRSGSLAKVVERYLATSAVVSVDVLAENLPTLKEISGVAILKTARNRELREALTAASATPEMRRAQEAIAFDLYMRPALKICGRFGFVEPLSLAVVYDSVVHGSFFRIAGSVAVGYADEREWIAAYVRRRDQWFASFPRLRKTRYRTRFFLGEIAKGNWKLELPIIVHGVTLSPSRPPHISQEHRAIEIHKELFIYGDTYMIVWPDSDGFPVLSPNRASSCVVVYDEDRPNVVTRAAKEWKAKDKRLRLNLFYPDRIERFISKDASEGPLSSADRLIPLGDSAVVPNPFGVVPVFHFANNAAVGTLGSPRSTR